MRRHLRRTLKLLRIAFEAMDPLTAVWGTESDMRHAENPAREKRSITSLLLTIAIVDMHVGERNS